MRHSASYSGHGVQNTINYLSPPASSDLVQEFHRWLSEQREIVKECSDRSGDTQIVERKLQKLKVKLILH